jgi:hypothetical protein
LKETFVIRIEDIHNLLHDAPFKPFRLFLSNGRKYDVRHPELVMIGRSSLLIGTPAQDVTVPAFDSYSTVSMLHITDIEMINPQAPAASSA